MKDGLSGADCVFLGAMFLITLLNIYVGWSSTEQRLDRIEALITCETEN